MRQKVIKLKNIIDLVAHVKLFFRTSIFRSKCVLLLKLLKIQHSCYILICTWFVCCVICVEWKGFEIMCAYCECAPTDKGRSGERDFTPPSFSLSHSNYGISESFMLNTTPPPIRVRKEEWEEKIQYTPSQPDMLQPHHAPAFMLQMARTGSTKSKILLEWYYTDMLLNYELTLQQNSCFHFCLSHPALLILSQPDVCMHSPSYRFMMLQAVCVSQLICAPWLWCLSHQNWWCWMHHTGVEPTGH